MVRVRQVTAAAALFAACGCAATDRLTTHYHDARKAVGLAPAAAPASQVSLIMQRKLAELPNPTVADGRQAGLPGQVFLVGSDGRPVDAAGDLTVTVADHTPRPAGQPARTTEKWQFGADVLAKLRMKDERFGDCYVLFLPWPADWKDVTRVSIRANYQAAGAVELHAQEVTINLDAGEQWNKIEPFRSLPIGNGAAAPSTLPPPTPVLPQQPQPAAPVVPPFQPVPTGPAGPTVPQTVTIPRS